MIGGGASPVRLEEFPPFKNLKKKDVDVKGVNVKK
jgi:hypothetical protein